MSDVTARVLLVQAAYAIPKQLELVRLAIEELSHHEEAQGIESLLGVIQGRLYAIEQEAKGVAEQLKEKP